MENKTYLIDRNIYRIQGFSYSIDNLIRRKLEEMKYISPEKKFSFTKKQFTKKLIFSREAHKLFGFLLKKFLFSLGKESTSFIFSNKRSFVNQNDILRCRSLDLFFKNTKDIFWYHRKTKILFHEKNIIAIRKTNKNNDIRQIQRSVERYPVISRVEKNILEQKKLKLKKNSRCRLNHTLLGIIERYKKIKKNLYL